MHTEHKLPKKKLGRPTVGAQAMTNKERQQRWRDRVKADADLLLAQVQITQMVTPRHSDTISKVCSWCNARASVESVVQALESYPVEPYAVIVAWTP